MADETQGHHTRLGRLIAAKQEGDRVIQEWLYWHPVVAALLLLLVVAGFVWILFFAPHGAEGGACRGK